MALLPMGPPTSTSQRTSYTGYHAGETQETMFDEPTATYEMTYDTAPETSYEPSEDYTEDIPELISYGSGTGHAGIDPAQLPVSQKETAAAEAAQPVPPETPIPAKESPQAPSPTAAETPSAPPAMLTANDFAALEERVLRAVTLLRGERQARIAAEERMASMEAQLHSFEAQIQQIEAQSPILERLVQEVESLRIEREQVRQRVERLLGQLDALEL